MMMRYRGEDENSVDGEDDEDSEDSEDGEDGEDGVHVDVKAVPITKVVVGTMWATTEDGDNKKRWRLQIQS